VAISSIEIATHCGLAMTQLFCSTFLNLEHWNIRICLGFRYSYFEIASLSSSRMILSVNFFKPLAIYMGIDLRRRDILMTKQDLNRS